MSAEAEAILAEQKEVWNRKGTLRAIYSDFHQRLERECPAGKLLDIGGGSAHFKVYRPDVVSLDIQAFSGIDVVADAHLMPFADQTFHGIVMLDVLHHLQKPIAFLREVERVLRPGGRIAMIEPGMSIVSSVFYGKFHQEPVDLTADPFAEGRVQSSTDPWDANQAIPTLMFSTEAGRRKVERAVPGLRVVQAQWLSLVAYPLSGGFKRWCLLPERFVKPLLAVEEICVPLCGPLLAFRLFIVLERSIGSAITI
jgi:SAM-dependent methyltransferase